MSGVVTVLPSSNLRHPATQHDCRFGISTCNGTLSLEAALHALGIGANDEVIVPPITFVATATAVLRIGAIPVFADIDPRSYNLIRSTLKNALPSALAPSFLFTSVVIRLIWTP